MDHSKFQKLLSDLGWLSPTQKQQAIDVLSGESQASASLTAIEARVAEKRQCPHCNTPGAVSHGMGRGLRRYRCKARRKTFNATTGTSLHGLHKKDRWLAYGECLSDGMTIRDSAKRCKLGVSTSFRWRHRFLSTQDPDPSNLKGIVEADETYVLESRKGDRNLDRKARRRGGKASKRGACQMNRFRYWLLQTAAEQRLALFFHLSSVTAASVQSALEPRIDDDILLVTDGNNVYPPCAKALGIKHEALNQSAGERVRGRLKLSQKLSQIGKFFLICCVCAWLLLTNNVVLPACLLARATPVSNKGRLVIASRPIIGSNQSNKQRPPVIHECRHSGGDLRALEILGCEPAPTPLVLQFVECVLCIAPIPIELGKCEVLPLPLQRGHQNAIFPNPNVRFNHFGKTQKQLVAFCGLRWQRHIVRCLPTPTHDNDTSLAAPAHQLQF